MTEQAILDRLRRRDPAALECIIDQYTRYLSSIVWSIIEGKLPVEDAEEIVSDVFLALWEQAEDVRPGFLRPWLASVARHKAINRLRGSGWTVCLEESLPELPCPVTPEQQSVQRELSQFLRRAVDSMGQPEREIFLRHYYSLQSVAEISQRMTINENTVKTKLRRGRQQLKELLTRWGVI